MGHMRGNEPENPVAEQVWSQQSLMKENTLVGHDTGEGRIEGGWNSNNNVGRNGFSEQTNRQIEQVWGRSGTAGPERGTNQ